MTKLIKVDLELPPFCEDLKFPSLCKGDYSKLYILSYVFYFKRLENVVMFVVVF